MLYQKPSFTVPAGATRAPEICAGEHWPDRRGYCVFCGTKVDAQEIDLMAALVKSLKLAIVR
ncbi:MAG: hypothetical protein M3P26_04455 [Gemmatimonadota bacterium]|nr:hypothetical protein [Gemmatimonadota bacterium]